MLPLVDVLNLGHFAFNQADAALDQEQRCLVLPEVSEFCPSPFSMTPSLSLVTLNQTDWEKKKKAKITISVNQ